MKCLRCGYCCIQRACTIVVEGFTVYKPSGQRCPHLAGDIPGECSCAARDDYWFPNSVCNTFKQFERYDTEECRVGRFIIGRMRYTGLRNEELD